MYKASDEVPHNICDVKEFNPGANTRKSCAYLTPSWSSKTDGKHRKKPSMGLTEVGQDEQHHGPNANEECDDEN
jgi:hypothetical protein